ncbi:MAG: dTDP-4-dehydrorhamnose 3,5-epimerase [Bacteroidetes bacterium GWE2_42_24]|nr:MAG: dTDP-4-dehydrorhamnose 3,5-epimerase [Bacteroidetes bacterium GWE2_42_24]OFY31188.1 MAG: dTDP-4-dehydrorhamnose 3,5-epimerase [Bacteroidetes bacterium GWF2_43_11]HCT86502.1 dTDP-4-dehydrorhamnose 3,5-epimerase [Candidatus Margulisiibacteriota bacterium]
MKIIETRIEGLLIFEPDVYQDNRGDFFESYNDSVYKDFGFKEVFVQENQSYSVQNVIRGLHYQVGKNAQGKLARVAFGKVLDVAVDLRPSSKTFGKYFSIELSQMNKLQFWIPPGFAHGLSVLSKEAVFIYKCTKPFSKTDERSIRFNDPDLQIDWEIFDPIVSDKDEQAPSFQEAINELIT